jgi:hypothetical protein
MTTRFLLFALSSFVLSLPLPCDAQALNDGSNTQPVAPQQTSVNNPLNQSTSLSVMAAPPRNQVRNRSPQVRNGLPPVSTDSFVHEAAGQAELIYGDEGNGFTAPPFNEFTQEHRIEAGITGVRAEGLTDGKASLLPNSWGGDEFCKPEPFSIHGQTDQSNLDEPGGLVGRFKM